jgi:hypothetical protein
MDGVANTGGRSAREGRIIPDKRFSEGVGFEMMEPCWAPRVERVERRTGGSLLMSELEPVVLTIGRASGSSGDDGRGTAVPPVDVKGCASGLGNAFSCSLAMIESITAAGAGACGPEGDVRRTGV